MNIIAPSGTPLPAARAPSTQSPHREATHAFNWSLMNVTTVGSNIFGVTKLGQSLAVVLAAAGMIFFPIFTAWVTTKFQNKRNQTDLPSASQNL